MHRFALLLAASLVLATGSGARTAAADPAKPAKTAAQRGINDKGTMRQCVERGGKQACRRVSVFQDHNAAQTALRSDPLDKPSNEVWLRAENLGEKFKNNIYKDDGSFDDAAL